VSQLGARTLVGLLLLTGCAARQRGGAAEVEVQAGPGLRELGLEKIAGQSAEAVAEVVTDVGRGLAFVVDRRGYLLTNRHVVEDCDFIEEVIFPALRPPRRFASVQIVYVDPRRDLALLKVDAGAPLPSLTLSTAEVRAGAGSLSVEERVLLLARGEDDSATFVAHAGRVNELEVFNPAVGTGSFVGLTHNVRRGQSGGPVLDRYGRAAGVVTWTWRDRVGGFAIPIAEAARMLRERPRLDTSTAQATRAESRANDFVAAVNKGDFEVARRMLSPSYSRALRRRSVDHLAELLGGDGARAGQMFFAALEELAIEDLGDRQGGSREFKELVFRTGTSEFRRELGVDPSVGKEQVISFFFELGQAYLSARAFGDQEPPGALDFAIGRLRTLDAARTFAFAELSERLGAAPAKVLGIEVTPGMYAPQAVVTLQPAKGGRVALQMRMEWGDWYVAQVQALGG
jgi:S1-C subfamily serine protease